MFLEESLRIACKCLEVHMLELGEINLLKIFPKWLSIYGSAQNYLYYLGLWVSTLNHGVLAHQGALKRVRCNIMKFMKLTRHFQKCLIFANTCNLWINVTWQLGAEFELVKKSPDECRHIFALTVISDVKGMIIYLSLSLPTEKGKIKIIFIVFLAKNLFQMPYFLGFFYSL